MRLIPRWWKNLFPASNLDQTDDKTQVMTCEAAVDRTEVIDCSPAKRSRPSSVIVRRPEKRIAMRYPCDRVVRCVREGTVYPSVRGRCRNVSRSGMGVVVADHVEPGVVLVIELSGNNDRPAHTVPVRVVHVRAMPIRGWFLGCSFAEELSEQQLKALV